MIQGIIASAAELRSHYRQASSVVRNKKQTAIDSASAALVATSSANGDSDVSPRGGDPGFVMVLDGQHLAFPDLNGNNLLDSLTGIIETGRVGMLFVIPGRDETLRVNGRAWVTTDDTLLDSFVDIRRPHSAVVVRVDELFVHCAKAFRRGKVWDPAAWSALSAPGMEDIVCEQGLAEGSAADLRAAFEAGYQAELAADRPEP
jgi:uncharacterized protein